MADSEWENAFEDIKVLILEDNAADKELLEYELRDAGFVFVSNHVENKESYIKALKEFCPDIILSDYELPSMNGREALQIRKDLCPETPFILVTGAVGEERAIEILTAGATDYVLKRNLSRLLPAINRALHEAYEHRKRKEAEAERDALLKELHQRIRERTEALENEISERKRAEGVLDAKRTKLQLALNSGRMTTWVYNVSTGTVQTDRIMREMWDLDDQEFVPVELIYSRIHPDDRDQWITPEQHSKMTGIVELDFRIIHRSGEVRWLQSSSLPSYGPDGTLEGVTGINCDITERKRIEKKLKESWEELHKSGEYLKLALEVGQLGAWDWNIQTGSIIWNNENYRLFGYEPGSVELNYEAWRSRVHPADIEDVEKKLTEARLSFSDYKAEFRTLWPDGTVRWLVGFGRFVQDDHGRLAIRSYGITQDITEQKRTEEALVESRTFLKTILDNTPDLIFAKDRLSRITFANPAVISMIGKPEEKIIGKCDLEFYDDPEIGKAIMANDRRIMESGQSEVIEEIGQTPEDYRIFLSTKTPYLDRNGEVIGILGITRDITEQKRAEKEKESLISELEETNRELESFTYSVSHDLRAPLRAIDGFSAMLEKDQAGKLDDEGRRRLETIRGNVKRMNHLIDDLLALSRIGRSELNQKKTDMEKIARSAWEQQLAANSGCKAVFKLGLLPEAYGDGSLLFQVFSNLFSNAVKYTRKRKQPLIEIGGKSEKRDNVYYVKDNGVGFSMKHYDKLFGVFQRLHSESEYEGTGVGLAIAQRIVHLHGGKIWAESKVNKGAVFYFLLPRERERE